MRGSPGASFEEHAAQNGRADGQNHRPEGSHPAPDHPGRAARHVHHGHEGQRPRTALPPKMQVQNYKNP